MLKKYTNLVKNLIEFLPLGDHYFKQMSKSEIVRGSKKSPSIDYFQVFVCSVGPGKLISSL